MDKETDSEHLIGRTLSGYQILERIGTGGMGTVYKANQLALGRLVALKVLSRSLSKDPQFVARFDREAKLLAKLRHPNIVAVIDKGQTDEHSFLVMEYVPGGSLKEYVSRHKLSVSAKCRIFYQICEALLYLHENDVVHRDIKPGNILMDEHNLPKLADFGLAKMVLGTATPAMPDVTGTGFVVGTPDYMAPEQRSGAEIDFRSDLYSLGVVFYEVLSGRLPKAMSGPPSHYDPDVPPQLDQIVLKLLEEKPERRFQKVEELLRALDEVLGEQGGRQRRVVEEEAPIAETIPCPKCHMRNPAGTQTCNSCGTPLWATCPQCGAKYPAADGVCPCEKVKALIAEAHEHYLRGNRAMVKNLLRKAVDLDPKNRAALELLEKIESDAELLTDRFEKITYSVIMFFLMLCVVGVFALLAWKLGLF